MSGKHETRVLSRLSFKPSLALENYLVNNGIIVDSVKTLDELTMTLSEKPYSALVAEVSETGDLLTKLLTKIESINPETEVIVVTDKEVGLSEDGILAKEVPLRGLVYAFLSKPVSEHYLGTLIYNAVKKNELKTAQTNGSRPNLNIKTEAAASGDQAVVLSASIDSLNSAVTITDVDQNIMYVNHAHERMFGYSVGELIGEKSSILYPSEDPSGVSGKIYEALLMVGWEGERLGLKKDGSAFPILEKTSVIKDSQGKHIGIVSVIDDISSKKELELALKESEERYRTFVETAKSAIIAVDDEDKVILYNPAAEELFEYGSEDVVGKDFLMLFPGGFRDLIRERYALGDDKSGPGSVFESKGLSKSEREFPIEVSFSKCKINGKHVVTAIIFDITERKHMQAQLHQSAKLAAVGELASGVTHEINNPLAVVIGYSEMMLGDQELSDETKKAAQSINREAERAKKVIQGLLSFARKHNPEKELIDLNDVIDTTLGLVSYELKKNGIELKLDLDPKLPRIVADPNQLQQVFMNLVINAEHAMKESSGPRELKISSGVKEGNSDFVQLNFEDSGPGIPADKLNKIFDPFYTTKPKGEGTGLGLSVSFGIIKEHGGYIYAENSKSGGARFTIDLPVRD